MSVADIVTQLLDNRVVFFLGAGASLAGRAADFHWADPGPDGLPNGSELTEYLAKWGGYPAGEGPADLMRVTLYVSVMRGGGPLRDALRKVFNTAYKPTSLHRMLAELPQRLEATWKQNGLEPYLKHQLFLTTNYDDMLEQAFRDAKQPFHVLTYVEHEGAFQHVPPGQARPVVIDDANAYAGLNQDGYPVVLKIHGTIDREDAKRDSFVITEDHYIDFVARQEITSLLPAPIPAQLVSSNLLFLGYKLQDWNLRVLFRRVWGSRPFDYQSWAVRREVSALERKIWEKRDVTLLETTLEAFQQDLADQLAARLGAAT